MIKVLMSHIKEFKRASILTPICMVVEVIFETIIPLLMASIVDDGVEKGDMKHIFIMGGVMVLLAIGGLTAGVLGGKYGAEASTGFAKNLRMGMYDNIQTFSFSNMDKYSTAGLVTRLTTDVTNLQMAYQMILRMCSRAPASLIIAMIASFYINARIASIYLVATVILGVISFLLIKKATRYFEQVFKKYDDLNASVQENITGIRVVKAFVREKFETSKFVRATENLYKMFVNAEKIVAVNMPVMMLVVDACIIGISWFGARFIVSGSMTTGELLSLLSYCMHIMMSLMMLAMVFVMITMSTASAKRITEVLNEKADIVNPDNPIMSVKDGSVDFNHVNFAYYSKDDEEKNVLSDIDVHIRKGETIGIIGGTGSSKSSLVNLISRLYDVTSGELLVGGVNVKEYDLEVLRNEVAVVLQKNVLFSGTIYENLRWGNEAASDEECQNACRLACADDFVRAFPDSYNTYIEQGGTNVSGGQKQRLCIARALLKKPKILILDDSTSAVDTATDARIRKALMHEIPDTTKFIIAQRVNSVQNADRIIVLNDGVINGIGTHEKLLNNNTIYRDVYESQTGGTGDFDEVGGAN